MIVIKKKYIMTNFILWLSFLSLYHWCNYKLEKTKNYDYFNILLEIFNLKNKQITFSWEKIPINLEYKYHYIKLNLLFTFITLQSIIEKKFYWKRFTYLEHKKTLFALHRRLKYLSNAIRKEIPIEIANEIPIPVIQSMSQLTWLPL